MRLVLMQTHIDHDVTILCLNNPIPSTVYKMVDYL